LPLFRTTNAPITIHSDLYAGTCDTKHSKKAGVRSRKRDADKRCQENVRSNGECWVAKWIFRFAHCSKNQAELQRRDSRPTAMDEATRSNDAAGSQLQRHCSA
jgi:hypothetical protein